MRTSIIELLRKMDTWNTGMDGQEGRPASEHGEDEDSGMDQKKGSLWHLLDRNILNTMSGDVCFRREYSGIKSPLFLCPKVQVRPIVRCCTSY